MSQDDEKPPLDAALRHYLEQQRQSLTSHPTPQELAAYHAGELPPEAEAQILEHLAICRECSDLLLDLSGFADLKPPQGVSELTDEQVEEDWQKLRSRMREGKGKKERTAEVVPIRPPAPPPAPVRWTSSPWLPVAASLLAVLGFSFGLYQSAQVGALRQQLEAQRTPWSPPSLDLFDETVRSEEDEDVQRVPSQGWAVLSLYFTDEETYPAYEAEIVGQANIPAVPGQGDKVVLVLPPDSLKPGNHEIHLFGVKGDQRIEVGTYQIQVDGP